MMTIFTAWRRERQTVRALSRLSDRALADVGMARVDIADVAAKAARIPAGERTRSGAMAPAWGAHLKASAAV